MEYGNPVDTKMNTTTIAAFTKPCGFTHEHSFGLNSSLWTDIRIISGRNTSGLAGKHLNTFVAFWPSVGLSEYNSLRSNRSGEAGSCCSLEVMY